MILSVDVKDTVAPLHTRRGPGAGFTPIGNAFFLNLLVGRRVFSYLVTNKHVVAGPAQLGEDIYLSVNPPGAALVEYVRLAAPWAFHADPAVDLALAPRAAGTLPVSAAAIPVDWIVTRAHLPGPLAEGLEVLFISMLAQTPAAPRQRPVVRQVHLASAAGEPLDGHYGPADYLLIECASHPAHSGSPLFVAAQAPDGSPSLALLGVVTAPHPQLAANANLSLVTPAEHIPELLQQPNVAALREVGQTAGRLHPVVPRVRDN